MSIRIPKYRLHKATGQALVQIRGKRIYLGRHGSAESRERYRQLLTQYLASPQSPQPIQHPTQSPTVSELILAYYQFAQTYYVKAGRATDEVAGIRSALRRLRLQYGTCLAKDFGPKAFKTVREGMIQEGLSRKYINDSMARIRRMYRWAASEELLPASVHQNLNAVPGLKRGRSKAKETRPVAAVSQATIEATIPYLPPVIADMVRLQLLSGCRPQEICQLKPQDIDRNAEVWAYRPANHKNEHRGHQRVIFLGPQAQAILKPYLVRSADAYCFSPIESERSRRENKKVGHNLSLGKSATKARSKRRIRDHYDRHTYRRAIHRACDKAFPHPKYHSLDESVQTEAQVEAVKRWQSHHRWSPNQLRHSTATQLRKGFGLEGAQTVLGHAHANTTEIYAEIDWERARSIMREVG